MNKLMKRQRVATEIQVQERKQNMQNMVRSVFKIYWFIDLDIREEDKPT